MNIKRILELCFGIDYRSLALFRIGLGGFLLGHFCINHSYLTATWYQSLLFYLSLLAGFFFIIGWQTFRSALFCALFLVFFEIGTLFVFFFWALFLPLGASYSVDRALSPGFQTCGEKWLEWASVGVILHFFMMILFAIQTKILPLAIPIAFLIWILPSSFWNKLSSLLISQPNIEIYYDGDCRFCYKSILLMKTFLFWPSSILIRKAQEVPPISEIMEKENSWVVLEERKYYYFRFDAFLQVLKETPLFSIFYPFLTFKPIRILGNALYQRIAAQRPFWSKIFWLLRPAQPRLKQTRLGRGIVFLFLLSYWIQYIGRVFLGFDII